MGQPSFGPNSSGSQYYPVALGGNLYGGANQAVVTTALSAGVPTTYTGGLVLANPIASTVNLVVLRVQCAFEVAQTNASVISLGVGYNATTNLSGTDTAVASQNALQTSANTAQGLLYSSASITLPTAPVVSRIIGNVDTGALTTQVGATPLALDVEGSVILSPGGYAMFLSSAVGTASSFFGSFLWVELPAGATAA